jgi:hypothetical protein
LRKRHGRARKGARGLAAAVSALAVLSLLGLPAAVRAQPAAAGREAQATAPRVFLDCRGCDLEFIKEQIPFARFVGSRAEAQVEVDVRSVRTEAGEAYILAFRGRGEFAGDNDQLDFRAEKSATPEEARRGLVQILKLGLLRYAGRLPVSSRISIKLLDEVKPTAVVDRWKSWVFSVSGNSFLNGEKSYRNGTYYGSFSANRVTPDWKIRLAVSGMYQKDHFLYEDEVYDSSSDSRRFVGLVVRSLDEHWSVGGYFEAQASSYSNIRLGITPAPAIEYDLFPYSESTRRQLRFLYRLNLRSVKYNEETVYGKLSERLLQQALSVTLELQRKWGTISTSLQGSNYFHDFSKNRLELWSQLSLRLLKGFNFNVSGGYSRIHDQLSLPAAGATLEEILLRRRQLETSYDYYLSVGLSFTFGSTQSHVVNPRFGDGAGGVSIRIGY